MVPLSWAASPLDFVSSEHAAAAITSATPRKEYAARRRRGRVGGAGAKGIERYAATIAAEWQPPDRAGRAERPHPAGAASDGPRPTLLLDCDPGHDDAVAIVVAAHGAELAGITAVAGNAPLERTAYNARVVRELLAIDVEVHAGANRPLVAEPRFAPQIHGASGLDGADLPTPQRALDGHDAAGFIIDTCRRRPGLWLVATGPLTNIATALRLAPDITDRIRGISLMGGGSFGNRSAVAEFNIWADPEAAHIVFESGAPITMSGLDVTHTFQVTPGRIARVRALGGVLATTLADLFDYFSESYLERHVEGAMLGAALHDPLAVLAVTRPQLFARAARRVHIELAGTHTRGMTVIDERRVRSVPAPNAEVLASVDADAAFDAVVAAIAAFTPA